MPVLSITMPFDGERELRAALAVLTVIDLMQLKWARDDGAPLPALYKSGVRYRREEKKSCWAPTRGGCEDWLSAVQVISQRFGDCEDLAAWRASELIAQGERAARAIPKRTREGWHIVVQRADGRLEDPSRILGMGDDVHARRMEIAALRARGELRT